MLVQGHNLVKKHVRPSQRNPQGGRINVETPSILLTLDDGYVRFYQDIYPELKETETAALLFVPTGFVDGGQHFWEDELRIALQKSKKLCVELNGRRSG